jgi:hypothetical protein
VAAKHDWLHKSHEHRKSTRIPTRVRVIVAADADADAATSSEAAVNRL